MISTLTKVYISFCSTKHSANSLKITPMSQPKQPNELFAEMNKCFQKP